MYFCNNGNSNPSTKSDIIKEELYEKFKDSDLWIENNDNSYWDEHGFEDEDDYWNYKMG